MDGEAGKGVTTDRTQTKPGHVLGSCIGWDAKQPGAQAGLRELSDTQRNATSGYCAASQYACVLDYRTCLTCS